MAGLPVCRIVQLNATGREPEGFATGFLISAELIITNHHVFAAPEECQNCAIQFGYEIVNSTLVQGTIFPFDTSRFFYTNEPLDFAIVGVATSALNDGDGLDKFKSLPLIPTTGKILESANQSASFSTPMEAQRNMACETTSCSSHQLIQTCFCNTRPTLCRAPLPLRRSTKIGKWWDCTTVEFPK